MFRIILSISLFFSFSNDLIADDCSISKYISDYLVRINKYTAEENYEKAKKELDILSFRYFKSEQSYERMLINQLLGNYYGHTEQFDKAIEYYEGALRYRKLCLVSNLQVRGNLAQAYFLTKQYSDVIRVLLKYEELAEKRGQEFSPFNHILVGLSYYYTENYPVAYEYITEANDMALKYNEDWLRYELSLAFKLNKLNEAIEVAQLLIFINPDKKEYWKQLSGLYFTQDQDNESLAGLEVAYDNNLLKKNNEYRDLARYFLYKNLPQKAVKVLNTGFETTYLEETKENYELMADSYFLTRDRENGIKFLQKSLKIDKDPKIAFKIARFAFEDENWDLSLEYFKTAKNFGWDEVKGRLDLLMGISLYELDRYQESIESFKKAQNYEKTKSSAEGWQKYVEEIVKA